MKPRYIYFDKKTGVITSIVSTRKRGRALYIVSNNETVAPFIMGTKGIMESIVAYDREQEKYVLLDKDNVIRLRYYGKELYKIPKKSISDYDLRIDLYAEGNALEVSIDPYRMSTMYATDFREEVCFENGTEIRIFIKNKDGSKLLKTIVIDAQNLLDNGQLFFELKDIDSNDMSFYTHRVFDKYMWRKGKVRFLSPIRDKIRFEIQTADLKRRRDDFEYHLIIKNDEDGIKIQNNIENPKLVKIFDEIEFYIVDKHDPTILYDKFILKPTMFKSKTLFVKTKEHIDGRGILYNHKYISVLLEGKNNE